MDITVTLEIVQSPEAVARIMFDPTRDPSWIGGARNVELVSPDPMAVGARVRRHGTFLGRKFSWLTELIVYQPGRSMVMKFVEGPMKGEVSYAVAPHENGSRVSIRNNAEIGFSMPGMGWMLRRSVSADLRRLKALVESGK